MLWKKTWQPETVILLVGGIMLAVFSGSLAIELFRRFHVAGFKSNYDVGNVLLSTLSLHGAVILLATGFLKLNEMTWSEVLGLRGMDWKRQCLLALGVLGAVLPLMFGLKWVSDAALEALGWAVKDQDAVDMFLNIQSSGLRLYMAFFAVILAPVAEEFIFRGMLFSAAKKWGWPKCGAVGVSFLFALVHFSAPIFLPLFLFALALTWLYQKTEGLLAPIVAHALFNGLNLLVLVLAKKFGVELHS
ncbi:MAG TPA: type II CAAX endopeptidase family protein [Verrucomicrobiae bacterium]